MKGIFFDAMAGKDPELVDVPEKGDRLDFDYMCKKIGHNCLYLDSTLRVVENRTFRIWVDDLGINNAYMTAYGSKSCFLFGNMFIFVRDNCEGNLAAPTQDDVELLKRHIGPFFGRKMLYDLKHPTTQWSPEELAKIGAVLLNQQE